MTQGARPRVALVLVSHSQEIARGTARLAEQMAPDVVLLPAGGLGEQGDEIGTSAERVQQAVEGGLAAVRAGGADELDLALGVVVLTDLGSAVLTAETVLELLDEPDAQRVRVPAAPFVEGAVAAAVAAQQGGGLADVEAAATAAGALFVPPGTGEGGADEVGAVPAEDGTSEDGTVTRRVTVRNPLGLHARPAAVVARAVSDLGVPLTIDGADGASVLALMRLGSTQGRELTVSARGAGAEGAVEKVVGLIEGGFGEV